MRQASPTDFYVDVESVGRFRFARRTMRDELRIGTEYSRLTEGVDTPTPWLEMFAGVIATLKVLAVEVPDGWDLEEMDPLDTETYNRMISVHNQLRLKESDFRRPNGAASKEAGKEAGGDDAVLVPPEVPAGANRPKVP